MSTDCTLTKHKKVNYNKGEPIRCNKCGRVDAFIQNNTLYVKCRDCKKWIPVYNIKDN